MGFILGDMLKGPLQGSTFVRVKKEIRFRGEVIYSLSFPGGSLIQNPPASARGAGLISGSGGSPGEENGNLLQYPCLRNPKDRRAWPATVHGVAKGWTQPKLLNNKNKSTISLTYKTIC